jgi:hypothetical protein
MPASVIEYFQKFNKPLPEQFCAKEDAAPQPLRNLHKNLRKPMKTSRPRLNAGATILSYRLRTSLTPRSSGKLADETIWLWVLSRCRCGGAYLVDVDEDGGRNRVRSF